MLFVLLAGMVVWFARGRLEGVSGGKHRVGQGGDGVPAADGAVNAAAAAGADGNQPDRTLVRSWLAISLVGGLLIFCGASFALDDTTLRSTLIGGLVSSAGSAVAFYFSTRAADQARQDVLAAAGGGVPVAVPNLIGLGSDAVNEALKGLPLVAHFSPASPDATSKVTSQQPAANAQTTSGSTITVTFTPYLVVPNLETLTLGEVNATLAGMPLTAVLVPPAPADGTAVHEQDPQPETLVPANTKVTVTFA